MTNDLTEEQWVALLNAWGGCAYCEARGVALQKDCVLPISRGGRYTLSNVVPACASCNASKCNAEVTSWMRRLRLDEPAFLVRRAQIVRAIAASEIGDLPGDSPSAAMAERLPAADPTSPPRAPAPGGLTAVSRVSPES